MNACVIGAGAWGTALAAQLARAESRVSLHGRDAGTLREIAERHSNSRYLPDQSLPPGIRVCAELEAALAKAEAVFVAVPSKQARAVYRQARHLARVDGARVRPTLSIGGAKVPQRSWLPPVDLSQAYSGCPGPRYLHGH